MVHDSYEQLLWCLFVPTFSLTLTAPCYCKPFAPSPHQFWILFKCDNDWSDTFFTTVTSDYCCYRFVSMKELLAHRVPSLTHYQTVEGRTAHLAVILIPSCLTVWLTQTEFLCSAFLLFRSGTADFSDLWCEPSCSLILRSPFPFLSFSSACVSHTFFRWSDVLIETDTSKQQTSFWYTWKIDLRIFKSL